MRCQEPTSAWRRLLIEGVSRRDEKNDSKSNHASLLMTCVLLDTPFPLCFLSGDFSAYILLACYFKRYFHWCPACVWAEPAQFYPKKFYGQLISCKIQVQSFTLHIYPVIYSRFSFWLPYESASHDPSPLILRRQHEHSIFLDIEKNSEISLPLLRTDYKLVVWEPALKLLFLPQLDLALLF